MAPLPGQTLTIRDPGLGLSSPATTLFAYFGTASAGTVNTVYTFTNPSQVIDTLGEGPLAEDLCYKLNTGGGPAYGVRLTGSVAGTIGSVTATPISTGTGTITVAGPPYDRYEVIVEIMSSGTVGTATFRYSLDDGLNYSDTLTVPSGAAYTIARTGLTLTFVPGGGPAFFVRGDKHEFDTVAPHYSATNLADGVTALKTFLSGLPELTIDAIILSGRNATGSAAATLFGAFSIQLASLQVTHRYMAGIMDAGSADTADNVKTAFAAVADPRIMVTYGYADVSSAKPYKGFGTPSRPIVGVIAAKAAGSLISTDLGWVDGGNLLGVLAISHDEYVLEQVDSAKITTLRTWPGYPGFYVTNGYLKSATGSDYEMWQYRRVMDVACKTVIEAQQGFVGAGFETKDDGSINDLDATLIEGRVRGALDRALRQPKNARGRTGHISEFSYSVDRQANLLSTKMLYTSVAVRPLGYAKWITTDIGFAVQVGG